MFLCCKIDPIPRDVQKSKIFDAEFEILIEMFDAVFCATPLFKTLFAHLAVEGLKVDH